MMTGKRRRAPFAERLSAIGGIVLVFLSWAGEAWMVSSPSLMHRRRGEFVPPPSREGGGAMYGGLAPRRAPASVPSSELFFGQMPDPVLLTSASASTMGARVDPGATFTFSVLLALYVWGQVKIRGALAAKEAREALEKEFNSVRAANLAGEISSSELDEAKAKIMDLKQKEEEARAVNFLGLKSRLVVPGLLPSVDEPSPLAPTSSAQQEQVGLKQPQPQQQKLQDEDDSPMRGFNGGQVALLSLVVLSQLWLLTVLSEDPMKFLQD